MTARLCECGCEKPLVQRPGENSWNFRHRRYATHECSQRAGTRTLPDRTCETCGALYNRRRQPGGQLEKPSGYAKRRFCPACQPARGSSILQGARRKPAQLPDRTCEYCGELYNRSRYADGKLENASTYRYRRACPDCRKAHPYHKAKSGGASPRSKKPRKAPAAAKPPKDTQLPPEALQIASGDLVRAWSAPEPLRVSPPQADPDRPRCEVHGEVLRLDGRCSVCVAASRRPGQPMRPRMDNLVWK